MGGSQGLRFNGALSKLFGDQGNFAANVEMEMKGDALNDTVRMPGRLAVADDKSRFEMDVTQIKGGGVPESQLMEMKKMGMDKTVMISRPDKKVSYLMYPNLQAYTETVMPASEAAEKSSNFKLETTELGKEVVDGHPCVKVKAVLTDEKGNKQDSTLWKATDLKGFPVKVERMEKGTLVTMVFKDIKPGKPEAKQFELPAALTKYTDPRIMIQDAMAKRFRSGEELPQRKQK